jgi:NAD(P)-dependent dehydrogenase (short-subunit alcohol dehydrogenase family)
MKIAVIDGQGGGIGRLIVEKLRQGLGHKCTILALGTNALATSVMLKAGANEGASGENAVVFSSARVDVIAGSVAILAANSYSGELTPRMAEAIASSEAVKVLIPLNRCGINICGLVDEPLPWQVDNLVDHVRRLYQERLAQDSSCFD